jgi:hypothetical protein
MGIFKLFSSCGGQSMSFGFMNSPLSCEDSSCGSRPAGPVPARIPGNPNPRRFVIERAEVSGDFLIAEILYPDCTNFEGRKLLVYQRVTEQDLRARKFLDPHFCDHEQHLAPVARFEPTERGWYYARTLTKECVPQGRSFHDEP